MNGLFVVSRGRRIAGVATLLAFAIAAVVLVSGASGGSNAQKPVRVAYLSFAIANSYDAPMLAAAQNVAKASKAKVTVFDAANDPKKQLGELQTAITSKQYNAIIVQPIFGPQLLPTVKQAISKGIKVVNMDQILGLRPGSRSRRSRAWPATSCSSRRRSARSRAASS